MNTSLLLIYQNQYMNKHIFPSRAIQVVHLGSSEQDIHCGVGHLFEVGIVCFECTHYAINISFTAIRAPHDKSPFSLAGIYIIVVLCTQ